MECKLRTAYTEKKLISEENKDSVQINSKPTKLS